jgi:hypothetical protein
MMYIYTVPDIISFTTYAHTRKTHKSALLSPLSQRTTTLKMPHGNHGCMHISLFKSPHIYTFSYKSLLKHAISCQLFSLYLRPSIWPDLQLCLESCQLDYFPSPTTDPILTTFPFKSRT